MNFIGEWTSDGTTISICHTVPYLFQININNKTDIVTFEVQTEEFKNLVKMFNVMAETERLLF